MADYMENDMSPTEIIARGHRHVAYLGARLDERTTIKQKGYEQAMLDAVGLSGAFPPARGAADFGITFNNAGPNKIDAYLTHHVTTAIRHDADLDVDVVDLNLHLTNNAPASGLWKSVDRGQTWSAVPGVLPGGLRILKLVVSPSDASTVYLVSGADAFVAGAAAVWFAWRSGAWGANTRDSTLASARPQTRVD